MNLFFLNKIIKYFDFKSNFNRNVLVLIIGTSIGSLITLLLTPVLTRLYTPEEFGNFAFYYSFFVIMSVIVTARYDLAVILPKIKSNAFQVVSLSFIMTLFNSALILLSILIFEDYLINFLKKYNIVNWIYFLPLSVFLNGIFRTAYQWFTREKLFRLIAKLLVLQSFSMIIFQIILSFVNKLHFIGLILGQIIGQIFVFIYCLYKFFKDTYKSYRPKSLRQIGLAKRYINFPKFVLIAHTLNAISAYIPNILFSIFFSTTVAGFYLIADRVISAFNSIVGNAVTDVFKQQASEAYKKRGECYIEYKNVLKKLIIISIIPYGLLFLFLPNIFAFIFGESWGKAGIYAQILTPMFIVKFVTGPLSVMFVVAEKQRLDLYWQISLFLSILISIYLGFILEKFQLTLILFSASCTLMYLINGFMTFHFSRGILNKLN